MIPRRALFHCALPLALGVVAYVLFRRSDIRLFGWLSAAGLSPVVAEIQAAGASIRPHVPALVRGSFADGAWAYAFGAAMGLMWQGSRAPARLVWVGAGFFAAAAVEVGQGIGVIPGVFDKADLVAMVVGYALGVLAARPKAARAERSIAAG